MAWPAPDHDEMDRNEKTERQAGVIELDPKYCAVVVRRWQAFTGQIARLDGSGCAFDEAAPRAESLAGSLTSA